jgi:KDO2-lipid IV(A) lauroyltransferase
MPKRKSLFAARVGAVLFRAAEKRFVSLSVERAEERGARLGAALFRLSRKHRERTLSNLAMCFPEWDDARRLEVARNTFLHFGRIAGDFLRSSSRSDAEVLASVEMNGEELFLEHAKEGAFFLTAHFGNWERMAHYTSARGLPLSVVARDADDSELNDQVLRIRERAGIRVLSRGNAARQLLAELRERRLVAVLPDQNVSKPFLPFFGMPAGTSTGPAVIALRAKKPLLPVFLARVGPGRYYAEVQEPLEPLSGYADPAEGLMAAYNVWLESVIRRYPDQWLWFHDRWKSARKRGLLG